MDENTNKEGEKRMKNEEERREKVAILPRISIPNHRSLVETVFFPDLFLSPFSTCGFLQRILTGIGNSYESREIELHKGNGMISTKKDTDGL